MNNIKNFNLEQSNQLPDFSAYGYQIEKVLGCNKQGGRITYQAKYLKTSQLVVIKRFSFYTTDWEGLKEIEREIRILKGLDHPGIPKYLDTFQHEGTVSLVQEYIDATCLATNRSYRVEEIEAIALQCLEILVYIQSLTPPIVHRDLKPENILWDEKTKTAYLIDFGFARVHGNQSIAISSMAVGTYGFIPPEALANKLNLSSDLYSLGVTLICLLCGISSSRIGSYIDDDCQIDARNLLLNVSLSNDFKNWLLMLVSRTMSLRYKNAFLALQSLKMMKGLAQKVNVSVTSVVKKDLQDGQIRSIDKKTEKLSSLLPAKKLSILAISLPIPFLAFPWIAVQSDSYFSLAKQLQENYSSIQNKVNLEDCYQGIYSASEAKTLEQAKISLERSSSCLNTIGYPISFAETEAQLDKLFTLRKLVVLAEEVQGADYRSETFRKIDELQESLYDEANVIKSNLDLLSQTQQKMNSKLFLYCLKNIIVLILLYYIILGLTMFYILNKFRI